MTLQQVVQPSRQSRFFCCNNLRLARALAFPRGIRPIQRILQAAVLIVLGLLISTAMAQPAGMSPSEKLMMGTWYGEFSLDGDQKTVQRFITTRRFDGSFSLQARIYVNGRVISELKNSGLWGVSNGLFFTITTEVNGVKINAKSPESINAYLIGRMEPETLEYLHVASGNKFRVTRLESPSAQLPD